MQAMIQGCLCVGEGGGVGVVASLVVVVAAAGVLVSLASRVSQVSLASQAS
jgi:hypothetical protein